MWFVFIFLSAACSALGMITMKLGVQNASPVLACAVSNLVVLLVSWSIVVGTGTVEQLGAIEGRTWIYLVLAGLATGGVGIANYGALKIGEVDTYIAVVRCSMVLTVVLSFVLLGDPFTWASAVGTLFILIGTILMIDPSSRTSGSRVCAKWVALMVVAIVLSSTATLLGKVGISSVDSTLGYAIFTVSVVVLSCGLTLITGKWKEMRCVSRRELGFMLLTGMTSAGMELLFYAGLKLQITSIVMPVDKLLSGLMTVILAYLVFHEGITRRSAVALILVAMGTIVIML